MKEKKETKPRSVGIDLGKKTYAMAIVGKGGKVTRSNGTTGAGGRQALYKKLRPQDRVALEVCSLAFVMAKEIEASVGCKVYVLNPHQLQIIYKSMKKTDKEDSLKLAHILEDFAEERLPVVAVPSEKEMYRRELLACSRSALKSRTRAINELHALFIAQGITTKVKSDFAQADSRQEAVKELTGIKLFRAEHLLKVIDLQEGQIAVLDEKIAEESAGDEVIQRLQEVPGVGPKVAFAFVAHVAAERFENASQVSNYLGLVPRVYMSGQTVRYGGISKRGCGYLRALLVQGSWSLTRAKAGGKLRERYEYMTKEKSIGKKKAIVAIARRLAELLYVMMRDGTRYESRPFVRGRMAAGRLAEMALSA
jgi:transposase